MKDRVPDLLVEQLALGELSPEHALRVRQRLEDDGDPRLAQLRASDAEILAAHPPELVARRIRNRLERLEAEPTARRAGWWFVAATVAVAAAAVLTWWIAGSDAVVPESPQIDGERIASLPPQHTDTERLKGDPALVLHRKVGSGRELLRADDRVAPGDELLVSYRADDATHGVIVSIDGAGEVTLHFPADAAGSTALQQRGTVLLHTFELDEAPAFERFLFVTADEPIEVEQVMDAARALARGSDPLEAKLAAMQGWDVVDVPLVRQSPGE